MHHIEWICFRVHIHVHTDQRLQPDKTTASTTTTFGKFVLLVQKWEGSRPPNNSESETLFCGKDHQVKFAEYSSLCKYIGTSHLSIGWGKLSSSQSFCHFSDWLIVWLDLVFSPRYKIILSHKKKIEKKYAPALDNYGQNCFVRSEVCL